MKIFNILFSLFVSCLVIGCTTPGSEVETTVKLNENELSLILGETHQLVAEVTPETAEVIWSSSDPSVVSVDGNGLITAEAIGEADITVTADEASASCKVTVTGKKAESVTLDITEAKLLVGDTLRLSATVLPEDTYNTVISWSSDNEAVATVDETGLVEAVSAGNASIVAEIDGVSATCSLQVITAPVVGDYYYADGTYSHNLDSGKEVLGIVFYVNEDQMSGKIIEMNEGSLVWGVKGAEIECYDRYDGYENTANIIEYVSSNDAWTEFPAFEYINGLEMGGLDWYLPSTVELKQLYCAMSGVKWVPSNAGEGECNDWPDEDSAVLMDSQYSESRTAFNERIIAAGGIELNLKGYTYFASTCVDNQTAWQINLKYGTGINMGRGGTNRVRGVAEF